MNRAVPASTSHTIDANNVQFSDIPDVRAFCGRTWLVAVLFDNRNTDVSKRKRSGKKIKQINVLNYRLCIMILNKYIFAHSWV